MKRSIDKSQSLLSFAALREPQPGRDTNTGRHGQRYASEDVPRSRAGLADTSLEARRRIASQAANLRARVLAFLVDRGTYGATDQECQIALGMSSQTQGPRRGELVKMGLVKNSGRRRRTTSGRTAIVWTVTTLGGLK